MLALYRAALTLRRSSSALGDGPLQWIASEAGVIAFARTEHFACVTNLSSTLVALPPHEQILLASSPFSGELLPSDTTVWLRTA